MGALAIVFALLTIASAISAPEEEAAYLVLAVAAMAVGAVAAFMDAFRPPSRH